MGEIKDFESFYALKLEPFLKDLKSQSKDVSGWAIGGVLFLLFAILSFLLHQILIGILFSIGVFVSIYKYTNRQDKFIDNYKITVINEIIKYLNPGMVYTPLDYMSPDDYEKSGLYRKIYDSYEGDDHMEGTYKNIHFYCSELETAELRPGRSGNSVSTIFKGLLFAAPLKINFSGRIYIWPAGEEQIANSIMDQYYRLMEMPDVYYVDTNNTVFENNFSVYSTNPSGAKSFIDQELMDRIMKFSQQINKEVRISFVDGICYVSIFINEELFQPSIFNPGSKEKIKEYFYSILLVLSIINQLNLSRYNMEYYE